MNYKSQFLLRYNEKIDYFLPVSV